MPGPGQYALKSQFQPSVELYDTEVEKVPFGSRQQVTCKLRIIITEVTPTGWLYN